MRARRAYAAHTARDVEERKSTTCRGEKSCERQEEPRGAGGAVAAAGAAVTAHVTRPCGQLRGWAALTAAAGAGGAATWKTGTPGPISLTKNADSANTTAAPLTHAAPESHSTLGEGRARAGAGEQGEGVCSRRGHEPWERLAAGAGSSSGPSSYSAGRQQRDTLGRELA
jgi:hypothetical protein